MGSGLKTMPSSPPKGGRRPAGACRSYNPADLCTVNLKEPFLERFLDDSPLKMLTKHLGEDRDYIKFSFKSKRPSGGSDNDPPGRRIDHRTNSFAEGDEELGPIFGRSTTRTAEPPASHTSTTGQRPPVESDGGATDQVGDVKPVRFPAASGRPREP